MLCGLGAGTSVLPVCRFACLWVWNLVLVVGLDGVAHCWVLKNHASLLAGRPCRLSVGGGRGVFWASFARACTVGVGEWVGGLVV